MSRQTELFERAAQCERLSQLASDPVKKAAFQQLRDTWIALANASLGLNEPSLAEEVAAIEALQLGLGGKITMH
jgi:hypothetical protein